jgi:hypothetical protein
MCAVMTHSLQEAAAGLHASCQKQKAHSERKYSTLANIELVKFYNGMVIFEIP